MDDCGTLCLDPTYLTGEGGFCEPVNTTLVGNNTVFSLPIAFNVTEPPGCSRNVSGNCSRDLLYYNVTQHEYDVVVRPDCVSRCIDACTARCFDQYCITRISVEVNQSATCIPRCLSKFLHDDTPPPPSTTDTSWHTINNTAGCLLGCNSECVNEKAAGCSVSCHDVINPTTHAICLDDCLGNATQACASQCVFNCTGNHSLAYGVPAPYNPADDYVRLEDLAVPYSEQARMATASDNYRTQAQFCYSNCPSRCNEG